MDSFHRERQESMKFHLEEIPIPKARHRTRLCGKKMIAYDPQSKKKYETRDKLIRAMKRKRYIKACTGTLHLNLYLGIPMPRSWPQKRKNSLLGRFCISRPDTDNYLKYYADVMNDVVYDDDKRIASLYCNKIYSLKPYVAIEILLINSAPKSRKQL